MLDGGGDPVSEGRAVGAEYGDQPYGRTTAQQSVNKVDQPTAVPFGEGGHKPLHPVQQQHHIGQPVAHWRGSTLLGQAGVATRRQHPLPALHLTAQPVQ